MRRLAAMLVLFGAAALAGCITVTLDRPLDTPATGEIDRGGAALAAEGPVRESVDNAWRRPETWPRRWGQTRSGGGVPGIVERVSVPVRSRHASDAASGLAERESFLDLSRLITSRPREWWSVTAVAEGERSFTFVPVPGERPAPGPTSPSLVYKFISGERDNQGVGDVVRMQRTWLAFYDTSVGANLPPAQRRVRGLAVVMPGMFGTPPGVEQVVNSLRGQGWAVLRVLAHPSRFTERATFVIAADADLDAWGGVIAGVLGTRAAECAYAVEETIEQLLEDRPELRGLPRLAVGLSGGAMVLPTVVARNPDAYQGAVLVAGGGDFLGVVLDSNYTDWIDAVRVEFPADLRPEARAAVRRGLIRGYRARAPLDSLYTAAALRGKPTLMLHGSEDRAVPAALGDELWQRLGRPERWVYNTGHELLFMTLPWELPLVMNWINQHVPRVTPAPPAMPDAGVN